ncbi:MAG TPA: hypothetical protein PKK01_09700 [Mycobacterium sp.]|nr:hypothetical protein [Mycobacterium sp.]HQE15507.1 hypothetical protein [Mycobacterium sp.]
MSVSARSFLIPAAALATAGAVALTPAMTSATSTAAVAPALTAAAVPAIHIEEIQLAGIGRDIYDSITNFVQYTVSSAEFWIDLIPLIGPPLADQLNINYFEGIQPLIASTVHFISDVIANPLNVLELAVIYGQNLFYTGYNWVSAQSQFFGLPPLAPIPVPPPLASVSPGGRGAAAAVAAPATEEATDAPAAVATAMESAVESAVTAETPQAVADVTVARPDARGRAARANADTPRPARAVAGSAEATTPEAAGAPEAAQAADAPQRGSAKSDRGAARAAR